MGHDLRRHLIHLPKTVVGFRKDPLATVLGTSAGNFPPPLVAATISTARRNKARTEDPHLRPTCCTTATVVSGTDQDCDHDKHSCCSSSEPSLSAYVLILSGSQALSITLDRELGPLYRIECL